MNRSRALEWLTRRKPTLAARYGVTHLALFGSTARDAARSASDILVAFDGTATAAPHRTTWANVPAGSYTLTARAISTNAGQAKQDPATPPKMPTWEAVSVPVTIIVNVAPTVALTAPAPNAVVTAPATITLTAAAADSDAERRPNGVGRTGSGLAFCPLPV